MKRISGLLILTGMVTFVLAVEITFRVNMSGVDDVSADGVHIAGNFPSADWDPTIIELSDNNNDNIYEVSLGLTPGDEHEYKYVNENNWELPNPNVSDCIDDGFGGFNRIITVPNENTTLEIVYFSDEEPVELTGQDITATFQVDMSRFDPAWYSNGVSIQGSQLPLNWDAGINLLTDIDENKIFTSSILFPAGTLTNVGYKFARCDADGNWEWEYIDNRTLTIDNSNTTQILDVVYFNNENPDDFTSQEVAVTFYVDVSDSVSAGVVFDSLGIYGQELPLDWCWLDVNSCEGVNNITNPMTKLDQNQIWTIDITFSIGTWKNVDFKFGRNGNDIEIIEAYTNHNFIINDSSPTQIVNSVYGNINAQITDCTDTDVCNCNDIPEGACDCEGNVDLGCGCGETGPSGCDEICGSTLELDECGSCGGSGIADGTCCDGNEPEEYYDCNGNCIMVYDVDENGICDGQLAIDNSIIPEKMCIRGIYPNPFNPIVNVNFDIVLSENIQINIFDISGAFVQTLYEGYLNSGNHTLNWNAESLPSGIYFILLKSDEKYITDRMILLK